jgi:hypothetical protein
MKHSFFKFLFKISFPLFAIEFDSHVVRQFHFKLLVFTSRARTLPKEQQQLYRKRVACKKNIVVCVVVEAEAAKKGKGLFV